MSTNAGQGRQKDYKPLTSLFRNKTLVLTDGLEISEQAGPQLEAAIDGALSNEYAALPGGAAIEMTNRAEAIAGRLPFVQVQIGAGTMTLSAVELRLLSFKEMIERLSTDLEAFKLFLMEENEPYRMQYPGSLQPWQRVDPAMILAFRKWLPRYYAEEDHPAQLQAVKMYCQLACKDGVLTEQALTAIVGAMEKPLAARRSRKR